MAAGTYLTHSYGSPCIYATARRAMANTIFIVLFTTIGMGSTTGSVVKAAGLAGVRGSTASLSEGAIHDMEAPSLAEGRLPSLAGAGDGDRPLSCAEKVLLRWKTFDKKYLYAMFRSLPEQRPASRLESSLAGPAGSPRTPRGNQPSETLDEEGHAATMHVDDLFLSIRQQCNDPFFGAGAQLAQGVGNDGLRHRARTTHTFHAEPPRVRVADTLRASALSAGEATDRSSAADRGSGGSNTTLVKAAGPIVAL